MYLSITIKMRTLVNFVHFSEGKEQMCYSSSIANASLRDFSQVNTQRERPELHLVCKDTVASLKTVGLYFTVNVGKNLTFLVFFIVSLTQTRVTLEEDTSVERENLPRSYWHICESFFLILC